MGAKMKNTGKKLLNGLKSTTYVNTFFLKRMNSVKKIFDRFVLKILMDFVNKKWIYEQESSHFLIGIIITTSLISTKLIFQTGLTNFCRAPMITFCPIVLF